MGKHLESACVCPVNKKAPCFGTMKKGVTHASTGGLTLEDAASQYDNQHSIQLQHAAAAFEVYRCHFSQAEAATV